jgi:hypothetical protein
MGNLGKVNVECKCKASVEVNEVEKANSRRSDMAIFTKVSESNAFHWSSLLEPLSRECPRKGINSLVE